MKKRIIALLLCLLLAASLFAGCTPAAEQGGTPQNVEGDGNYSGRTLEVLLAVGGGGNYYEPVKNRLEEVFEGLTVNLNYDSNASDTMRQKVLSGATPDIFNLNQGMYDFFGGISEGVLGEIGPYLDLKTVDGSQQLKDVVTEDMLGKGLVDGKYYLWPEITFTSGLWYNGNLLKDNGIDVPETWADFAAAAETLDKAGVDVLGYCGMMAHEYPLDYMFFPFLISQDKDAFVKVQNLDDDAWDTEAMVTLVNNLQDLRDKGYTDQTTIALGNSETQMQHIAGNFAFLPCGSWLEAEMADAWTADWQLDYLPYSGRTDASGDNYIHMISLISGVSATTKNADLIGEFYRYMYSDDTTIKDVVGVAQNGLPIADFGKNYGSLLNQSTAQTWAAIDNGSKTFQSLVSNWYADFPTSFADAFNSFMGGQIDGDAFRARMAEATSAIKKDSEVTKYTYAG